MFVVVDDTVAAVEYARFGAFSSNGDTITLGVDGFMKSFENVSEKQRFETIDEEDGDMFGVGVSGVVSESLGSNVDCAFASEPSKNDRPTELTEKDDKLNSNNDERFSFVRILFGFRLGSIGVGCAWFIDDGEVLSNIVFSIFVFPAVDKQPTER